MTGNFTPTSFCEPYIHWINDEYAAFYQGIIDDIIAHPHRTVEEVALEHCEREMGENTYKDLRMALHRMIFIDIYVRNYWRREAVKVLVDAGIQVDVFGKGWDELTCEHPENMILHPQTTSEECLKAIAASKISLNVMPWFKDGAHDRVFNSILNDTVSVTDTSKYLCEELKEGQGVCYYDLAHMEKLPELVRDLLADDARREEIVRAGILWWKKNIRDQASTSAAGMDRGRCGRDRQKRLREKQERLEKSEEFRIKQLHFADNEGIMSEEIGSDESYDRKAVSESRWQV